MVCGSVGRSASLAELGSGHPHQGFGPSSFLAEIDALEKKFNQKSFGQNDESSQVLPEPFLPHFEGEKEDGQSTDRFNRDAPHLADPYHNLHPLFLGGVH